MLGQGAGKRGAGIDLGSLPVPRLVVVSLDDPAVFDVKALAAAVGAPDAYAGELPVVFATLRPGASTEVYVVRDKNWTKKQEQLQTRPRLDNNGNFGLNGYQRVAGAAPMSPSRSGLK